MINSIKTTIKSTIWRYYAFTFFWSLHFFSAVLVPFFTQWGGITKTQMFLLQSWFLIWIFLLEVPTGAVADYLGRKVSLTLGALCLVLATLVYGSIPRFEIFLLGEFLFALSFALVSGANDALLYDALKEAGREDESKKIFGRAHSLTLLGFLISAPIGSFIASSFDVNFPMLFTAIPMFIAAILALSIKEPKVHEGPSESKRYIDIVNKGFKFFYQHKTLRLIALDAIIVSAAAYYVIWLYQPLLLKLGIPIFYFGSFHVIMIASEIAVVLNFIGLEKIFGSARNYLSFSALITSIAFIMVSFFQGMTTIVFVSMFRRFTIALLNPIVGILSDKSLGFALLFAGLLPLLVFFFSPVEKSMLEEKSE
ncbi:MFS transporter [Candidatus Roizmanbacteria bacterium]|nr:MFS transporter [Candidatus Roizmanbacteria bacterium]